MLLTAEDIDDWEVIDLEECHGLGVDIWGGDNTVCYVFTESVYYWNVIDLEGCHGPEGDILGGYVTSLVLLLGTTILCRK